MARTKKQSNLTRPRTCMMTASDWRLKGLRRELSKIELKLKMNKIVHCEIWGKNEKDKENSETSKSDLGEAKAYFEDKIVALLKSKQIVEAKITDIEKQLVNQTISLVKDTKQEFI